jgi:hypothetical protein
MNIYLHLLINFLGTLILGAINYAMQCLFALTRAEVNAAHAKGKWLDIGVLSARNLRLYREEEFCCGCFWVLRYSPSLVVSIWILVTNETENSQYNSYNSIVYATITANEYIVFGAYEDRAISWRKTSGSREVGWALFSFAP